MIYLQDSAMFHGYVRIPKADPISLKAPPVQGAADEAPHIAPARTARSDTWEWTEDAKTRRRLPSGKLTVCYWKWPFIVSFPIKNGDFP